MVIMPITAIQTYPVKGLSASGLDSSMLEADRILANDRIYAILREMPGTPDPVDSPEDTSRFLTLSRNPGLGKLRSRYTTETCLLELFRQGEHIASGRLDQVNERICIEECLMEHLGKCIQGRLRIVHKPGSDFSYKGHARCLSLVNLASIAALERIVGRRIDPSRFRANIYFRGEEPWEEFAWVGRSIRLGERASCMVQEPIERCAAINIDPSTGERDMSLLRVLFENYRHRDMGVYVRVVEGGDIAVGQAVIPIS